MAKSFHSDRLELKQALPLTRSQANYLRLFVIVTLDFNITYISCRFAVHSFLYPNSNKFSTLLRSIIIDPSTFLIFFIPSCPLLPLYLAQFTSSIIIIIPLSVFSILFSSLPSSNLPGKTPKQNFPKIFPYQQSLISLSPFSPLYILRLNLILTNSLKQNKNKQKSQKGICDFHVVKSSGVSGLKSQGLLTHLIIPSCFEQLFPLAPGIPFSPVLLPHWMLLFPTLGFPSRLQPLCAGRSGITSLPSSCPSLLILTSTVISFSFKARSTIYVLTIPKYVSVVKISA